MTTEPCTELEDLAETVEDFYADATRFRMAVEQYEAGNLSEGRVEDAYRRAERSMDAADARIGTLLEDYVAGRMDRAMREHGGEQEDRSAAALAESIDTTYLDAVDAYYDARHAYTPANDTD